MKAVKDLEQAAALAQWRLDNGQGKRFNAAWRDALGRGRGWKKRAEVGRKALIARHPGLQEGELWGI